MTEDKDRLIEELTEARRQLEAENTRLREAVAASEQLAETLQSTSLTLVQTLDLDTVLEQLLDHLARLVPYDSANVMLLEDDFRVSIQATRGYEKWTDPAQVRSMSFDVRTTPTLRTVLNDQRSLLIADMADYTGWQERQATAYIHSWLGVPLIVRDKVIGLYSLDKAEADFFTEKHMRLAEALAADAAVAIENARLYQAAQEDLAERGRIETELQEYKAQLEEEVARRTAELEAANDQLRREITKRDRMAGALQENEKKFRALFESASDAIIVSDKAGKIILLNAKAEEMFGYERNELLNQPVEILVPERFRAGHYQLRFDYYDQPRTRPMGTGRPLFGRHRDGSEFPVDIGLSPVEWNEERLVMSFVIDITTRIQAEEELRAAKERAEAADRAKSQFLAHMSHELRTPLNAIIGYSEMLQEDVQEFGVDQFIPDLEKIGQAGRHLLNLINSILDLSKIEAGKMELHPQPIDVKQMVREVTTTIQPLIDQNRNTLKVEYTDPPTQLYTDLTKLQQVLFNLLSNAAKFTTDGVISLAVGQEGANRLALQVADTGVGIRSDQLEKLFEPFTQVGELQYDGTGLGLVISRHFCRMMGGDLTAKSVYGEGSTFTATLLIDAPEQ